MRSAFLLGPRPLTSIWCISVSKAATEFVLLRKSTAAYSLIIVGLFVAVAIIYSQVRTHPFVDFDDPLYVSQNEQVLRGLTWPGIVWALTHIHAGYWLPLTWISHMLDVQMFGRDAGAHLLVSAALHAINAALLFLFVERATGAFWRSAVVAALFAVHPLHVESVAWVAERKDTLSTLLFLLCLLAYTQYVRQRSRIAYAGAIVALALGLMAKPMLVTTPLVLLLLDYWPFRRLSVASWRHVFIEKIPFVIPVAGEVVATLVAQRDAIASTTFIPMSARMANAAISYVTYVIKTLWPAKLAVFYPFPTRINLRLALADAVVLIALTIVAFVMRHVAPELFVGWCWFVVTLIPVIGLVQAGQQALADRFTYIPHIGLFIAIVWGVWRLAVPKVAVAAAAVSLIALSVVAHAQVRYWSSSVSLFDHALAVTSNDNKVAHINLAAALLEQGQYSEAEHHYRAAVGYQMPDVPYNGLALSLSGQGKMAEAGAAARAAVKANPNNPGALTTLASIALAAGNTTEAQWALSQALKIKPDVALEARLAATRGEIEQARRKFEEAVNRNPSDAELHNDYAAVLARLGDDAAAQAEYENVLRLNPNLYDMRMNYGALLSRIGRDYEAAQHFNEAVQLRPGSPEPHVYLALLDANGHRFDAAEREIQQAIAIDHDASNRVLINAIRIPPRPGAIDEYLAFLHQQSGGR